MGFGRGHGGFSDTPFQFAAVGDYDLGQGTIFSVDLDFGHAVDNVEAGDEVAEDGVFGVQVWGGGEGNEESVPKQGLVGFIRLWKILVLAGKMHSLTTVGAFPSVRHAHEPFLVDLSPPDILIFEIAAVDAYAACAVSRCDVPTLDHEFIDDAVEAGEFISYGLGDRRWGI